LASAKSVSAYLRVAVFSLIESVNFLLFVSVSAIYVFKEVRVVSQSAWFVLLALSAAVYFPSTSSMI